MKKLLLALLFVPLLAFGNPIDDKCPQFVLRGAPVSKLTNTQYICKTNYAIHYRYDTRTPEYVVEHVTKEAITGPAKRKDDFRADPAVPPQYQSVLSDYAGFPYDRGHLAPGANNTQSAEIMSESFFLTNMMPQVPNNNRGIWKQLEEYIRDWVEEGKDIYLVTGTYYAPGYQTIGNNKVGVPTHIWKVIIDRQKGKTIGFFMPNAPLPVVDLPKYAVSVEQIEQTTGINFMPQLPANLSNVEKTFNLADWSKLQ
jgi:endonuclease G